MRATMKGVATCRWVCLRFPSALKTSFLYARNQPTVWGTAFAASSESGISRHNALGAVNRRAARNDFLGFRKWIYVSSKKLQNIINNASQIENQLVGLEFSGRQADQVKIGFEFAIKLLAGCMLFV